MKIAITGATGQLGRIVVNKLKEKVPADNIVALVRSPQKAADLGVEAREADYERPETLNNALKGIDTLLLISGNEFGKRVTQHRNVIEAAKRAGVKWVVYTSGLRADNTTLIVADDHLATEVIIKESGIPFTILRHGWYTENYTGSIPGAIKGGAYLGSAGDGKIATATRADYAEADAAVLTTEGHIGKTYELAGDEAFTLSDLAAEVSRQTGKNIPYKNLPEPEYAAILKNFGIPGGFADALASCDVSASKGDLYDDSHHLSQLIGRRTTPLSEVVAETLKGAAHKDA